VSPFFPPFLPPAFEREGTGCFVDRFVGFIVGSLKGLGVGISESSSSNSSIVGLGDDAEAGLRGGFGVCGDSVGGDETTGAPVMLLEGNVVTPIFGLAVDTGITFSLSTTGDDVSLAAMEVGFEVGLAVTIKTGLVVC